LIEHVNDGTLVDFRELKVGFVVLLTIMGYGQTEAFVKAVELSANLVKMKVTGGRRCRRGGERTG
jgi:hypothetical protein